MQTYTFRANSGDLVTVTAPDEATARHLAMEKLHGKAPQAIGQPPVTIGHGGKWVGYGLALTLPPGPAKED